MIGNDGKPYHEPYYDGLDRIDDANSINKMLKALEDFDKIYWEKMGAYMQASDESFFDHHPGCSLFPIHWIQYKGQDQ